MIVHQDECMKSDAMVAKRCAQQSSEMVAILRVEEDRTFVDASLRDVQWCFRQFKARQSWHGSRRWRACRYSAPSGTSDLSASWL